jgi:hypothetical protein
LSYFWAIYLFLLSAVLLALLGLVGADWLRKKRAHRRFRYASLLDQLGVSVEKANLLAPKVVAAQNLMLIDYYAGSLGVLESLIRTVRRMQPHAADTDTLIGAQFLANTCHRRFERVEEGALQLQKGCKLKKDTLVGKNVQEQNSSCCFFCSKPYTVADFKGLVIKYAKQQLDVLVCQPCFDQTSSLHRKGAPISDGVSAAEVDWKDLEGFRPGAHQDKSSMRQSKRKLHLSVVKPPDPES